MTDDRANYTCRAKARPVRLAFLVNEDDEERDKILSAIFEKCFGVWAGRFSLIVPCVSGSPRPAYDAWLREIDPDIIYSFAPLTAEQVLKTHETLYPSHLVQHPRTADGSGDLRVRLPIDLLKATSLIPLAALPGMFEQTQSMRLISAMGSYATDRFIKDNFGTCLESLGSAFPPFLRSFASLISVIRDDELQPRQRYLQEPDSAISSPLQLLQLLGERAKIRSMAQLSALMSPRLETRSTRWGDTFNIVVGDSFCDRVLFWNARHHSPLWRDGSDVDLIIPSDRLENDEFVAAVHKFLLAKNFVSGNSSGPYSVTLRSISKSEAELKALAERLNSQKGFMRYGVERISSVDECVPEKGASGFGIYRGLSRTGSFETDRWEESLYSGNSVRLIAPTPEHMKFVPAPLQTPYEGTWAVDLDIERNVGHSQFSNVRSHWQLPHRLRTASKFIPSYRIESPFGQLMHSRVNKSGHLSYYSNVSLKPMSISIPSDYSVLQRALVQGRDWSLAYRTSHDNAKQRCFGAERSANGRQFWAVFDMFGSLNSASNILLHAYWREQFSKLGASTSKTESQREIVRGALRNRFRHRTFDMKDKTQLDLVATIVLAQADIYRRAVPIVSWPELKSDHEVLVSRYIEEHFGGDIEEAKAWSEHVRATLPEGLQELCSKNILHQGYEHQCPKCLHRSWISIATLNSSVKCEVCGRSEQLPVDQPWQFRLNEFLREAIRKHGIEPLFWILKKLRSGERDDSGFFFEGPMDIYFDHESLESGTPSTDIDLIVISKGAFRICEAKQSARQISSWKELAITAIRLEPDIATIGIMEPETPEIRKGFEEYSKMLLAVGIQPELLTLDAAQDFDSEPFV